MIDLSRIPNVVVGERLGFGTFGEVYRARHRMLDIDVAVKTIEIKDLTDAERVLSEARLMARLDHPNLLRIFDAGQVEDGIYFILELMDGTCAAIHNLSCERTVDLTLQLLGGLQALHDARILHRDIKPANCLLRVRDGRVKIADLGIALEQRTLASTSLNVAGTIPFMAPELFQDPPRFSSASDLYALGMTLRCMVALEDPFPRLPNDAMVRWVMTHELVPIATIRPDQPPRVATAIDKMCARLPPARPQSAAEAITLLTPALVSNAQHRDNNATLALIGSWIVGEEVEGDANFQLYAVTHIHTGAAGRIALLKERCPLRETAPLILQSAERATHLSHKGIADVVDWGMFERRAYIVTRAQGQTLRALVESSGPLPELEAITLTLELAEAVAYLHEHNLVYQVVSPPFAMLRSDARTVQLAWPMFCVPAESSARAMNSPMLISLPLFSAPEALVRPSRTSFEEQHEPPLWDEPRMRSVGPYEVLGPLEDREAAEARVKISASVDIYGLGEILYYLIAGKPAYSSTPDIPDLVFAKLRAPADLRNAVPSVSAPTAQLVAELTSPDKTTRPRTALAVRDRLGRIARLLRP